MFWSEYTFWDQIQILSQIKYKYVAFLDVNTNTRYIAIFDSTTIQIHIL